MCFSSFLFLKKIRGYQASNLRGNVYAALSVPTTFLRPGENMSIVPDYSLPVVEVYRRVTLFPIENLPNLSVLSYLEIGAYPPGNSILGS
jgi:hypothetical protein